MSHLTTHVLDTALGRPAEGVEVVLEELTATGWRELASGTTNADGRIAELGPERLASGVHRLWFGTGDYLQRTGQEVFFPQADVVFLVDAERPHYHVPLLLSPFGWQTYRGS